MDHQEREELRFAMETQFRYKLYRDPAFPYFYSMGCDEILQGFGNKEVGFLGILQLNYVDGEWLSTWHDEASFIVKRSQQMSEDHILDLDKLKILILERLTKIAIQKQSNVIEERQKKPKGFLN